MNAQELITEHLDIWTTAQEQKKSGGRGRGKKKNGQSLYGIKKLRELILDLAVRGKLVEQNPEDEPASVLLEKIAEEKARLIKEKKIKKQKKLPEITEEDKPFALPNGWEWARLGSTGLGSTGKTPSTRKPQYYNGSVPFIGPGQITPDGNIIAPDKTLTKEGCEYSVTASPGDILMVCIGGSIGKSAITQSKIAFNQQINSIHPLFSEPKYLYTALNTPSFQLSILAAATGSATPIINRMKWEALMVALPPLPEQHRIVAKVEELMVLCDQLEHQQTTSNATHQTLLQTLLTALTKSADHQAFTKTWEQIATHFDLLFTTEQSIDQLKQTILQLAVMGKLVPQNPEDEPASVLLEKIAKEKARLIKEGKIKKQKKLPEITEEEKPFVLPDGWEWISLSHLGVFSGGKTPSKQKQLFWDGDIPWVTPKDMKTANILGSEDHVTTLALENGLALYESESILFVVRSGILRHSFPVAISKVSCTVNQDLKVLSLYVKEIAPYVYLMMRGFEKYILDKLTKKGMTVESVKFAEFSQHYFLMPPLAEQHRIVAKVNELMTICNQLKTRLHENQTTKLHLADTIVNSNGGCHAG